MNFKKNWKRFWTLSSAREGFTLVELIVVIAILAILAGVAVPAYSGYVTKANKQADMTLASEVAHALTLYYYAHPETAGGYVTISKDGTTASNSEMKAAMAAVFGEGWDSGALVLKADWTDASGNSMLMYAINNAENAQVVANSTFLSEASTDSMLNALTTVTGIVSDVISSYTGDVEGKLTQFVGEDFVTALNATGMTSNDPGYVDAISNMMVGHFANMLNSTEIGQDNLVDAVYGYAIVYAYAEANNDTKAMAQANAFLSSIKTSEDLESLNMETLYASLDESTYAAVGEYLDKTDYKDMAAIPEIMGALGQISGNYTDKESLANPDLYNSESVKTQANDYVNAIKTVAGMDADTLAALQKSVGSGSVVVSLMDGMVVVSPVLQ